MSKDVVKQETVQVAAPNFPQSVANFDNINQGTVAVESSRAIAEAQGKLVIAKRFPRDEIEAFAKVMTACQRRSLAEKAFYSYPRGGETVQGPTIRFAEELARCWGNLDYGIKELSQGNGTSEMQAYCWDLETNTMSIQNFTNPHRKEVKNTIKELTSLRDIYENNANMAARRLRARILAVLPSDLVDEAIKECRKTLTGNNETPLIDRVKNMTVAFGKMGVTQDMIEGRLKRKIETMTADDFADYIGIFNSLKEGNSKISDWFEYEKEATDLANTIEAEDTINDK
jgi:hypothetical protein